MKKKPKISYSELAGGTPPAKPSPAAGAQPPVKAEALAPKQPEAKPAAPKAEPKPKRAAKPRAPKVAEAPQPTAPPVVAPDVVPEVQMRPRVSSPVEIAAVLRTSPPRGIPAYTRPEPAPVAPAPPVAPPPAPAAIPPAPAAAAPDTARVDPNLPAEQYAEALALRLAAMAPPEIEDAEEVARDARPLRERVRSREGIADLLMFRIGAEIFATELAAVEEAVSLPEIHHLPEMPAAMLGAFNLRGRLTPVYSPAHVIGVPLAGSAQAALLVRANGRRLGLAVDDVEDVFQVDLATLREAPGIDDADGILLGVAHHAKDLVAVLDAEALVAACLSGHVMETA